jgi:type VI secretion system protein
MLESPRSRQQTTFGSESDRNLVGRHALSRALRLSRLALAVSLALLLAGCAKLLPFRAFFGGEMKVAVSVPPGINQNSPVPVEVILVYDTALLAQLNALSAEQWFAQREQFVKTRPPGNGYQSQLWVWVPGQSVPQQSISYHPLVRGGIVFAGYFSPGDHRVDILPFRDISIALGRQDFTVGTM